MNFMRASRLLSILILLQLRVRLTAEALAQEFEVSVRTIYRDIDQLSAAGVPVYGDRGPGGGFQLLDGYRTRLTGLAADEAEAMLMIGLPGPAAALGLGPAASRAANKLLASLPGDGAAAGRIGARFHLDPVEWYQAEEPIPHLPMLARAVLDQQRMAMTYRSWSAQRDWTVEPLGLVLKATTWYLVARGRDKIRTFRVSNMANVSALDERFDRPAGFDLPCHWRTELARFEQALRTEKATLRVSPTGLKRLTRLGAYAVRAIADADPPDADGWRRLRLPIESIDETARALLGIGPEIEIIEPAALRDAIRAAALAIAERMTPN